MTKDEQQRTDEEIRRFYIKVHELTVKEAPSAHVALNTFLSAYVSLASFKKIPIEEVKDTFQKILNNYEFLENIVEQHDSANGLKVIFLEGDPNVNG